MPLHRMTDDVAYAGTAALMEYLRAYLPDESEERGQVFWTCFKHLQATLAAFQDQCQGECRGLPVPSDN